MNKRDIKRVLRKHLRFLRILYWKMMVAKSWSDFKKDRKEICTRTIQWCESSEKNKEKFKEELVYLKKFGATHFPYKWADISFIWKLKMGFDNEDEPYVFHKGHKLYIYPYPYSQLLLEQNEHSAHRYMGGGCKGLKRALCLSM